MSGGFDFYGGPGPSSHWDITDYALKARAILNDIGLAKAIYNVQLTHYFAIHRAKNPDASWNHIVWLVFREICPLPSKVHEAWKKWCDLIKEEQPNRPEDFVAPSKFLEDVKEDLNQGAFGPSVYPGCAAVRNDPPPAVDTKQLLNALRAARTLSSLGEWEKASVMDALSQQRPAVVDRVLWDLAQHLVNAKHVSASSLLYQLSLRDDLTLADKVFHGIRLTLEYLPDFTLDDLMDLAQMQGGSRRDVESLLQGTVNPVPVAWQLAPHVPRTPKVEDEPKIFQVKILPEGQISQTSMSNKTDNNTTTVNALVASMQLGNRTKEMTAAALIGQTTDKPLQRKVTALMLCLEDNDNWRAFVNYKGAARDAAAEATITRAVKTGEPARFVISDMVQYPGYLALAFLEDLKAIGVKAVTVAADQIMLQLASTENADLAKAEAAGTLNATLRAWIEQNGLCESEQVQSRLDALIPWGIKEVGDMQLMTEHDFRAIGFHGITAAKAVKALPKLEEDGTRSKSKK